MHHGLNHQLDETHELLRRSVYQFAQKEVAPLAAEIDGKQGCVLEIGGRMLSNVLKRPSDHPKVERRHHLVPFRRGDESAGFDDLLTVCQPEQQLDDSGSTLVLEREDGLPEKREFVAFDGFA